MPLEIIDEIRPRTEERAWLRKVVALVGAVCLVVLLAIAATWPTKAHADTTTMVYKETSVTLTLFRKPCETPEILKVLEPELRAKYQAASLVYHGRTLRSCWLLTPEGAVTSMDEEGDRLFPDIPLAAFKKDTGA